MTQLEPLSIDDAAASKYLSMYLREAPVATALWRSIESCALATADVVPPVLDIGCGFGEFARLFFADRTQPDVGVDIDRGELKRAAAVTPPIYRSILQCDAGQLPFPDDSFQTVISISTLEHIPSVEATITDACRVLRPRGTLVFTVPIEAFNENLIGHKVLGLGSRSLADGYANAVHKRLTHVNVWPAQRWLDVTSEAGFTVERACATVSPAATRLFELLLPAAFASRMFRYVTGRRPPHPAPFVRAASRMLRPSVVLQTAGGSNLFVVARKGT